MTHYCTGPSPPGKGDESRHLKSYPWIYRREFRDIHDRYLSRGRGGGREFRDRLLISRSAGEIQGQTTHFKVGRKPKRTKRLDNLLKMGSLSLNFGISGVRFLGRGGMLTLIEGKVLRVIDHDTVEAICRAKEGNQPAETGPFPIDRIFSVYE